MHILVTGAGGMAGSHIVEHLCQRGHDVTGIWHKNKKNVEQIMLLVKAALVAFGIKATVKQIETSAFFVSHDYDQNKNIPRIDREHCKKYKKMLQKESSEVFIKDLFQPYSDKKYTGGLRVYVIGSKNDAYFPTDSLKATAEAFDTEAEVLPGLCHDMMLDPAWKKSADAVRIFCDSVASKE